MAARITRGVLAKYGTTCHLCGRPGASTADHVIPRSRGGLDTVDACRPAHKLCNQRRGDRTLAEWFAEHPLAQPVTLPPSREW